MIRNSGKTNSGKDKLQERQTPEKTNSGKDKLRKDNLRKRQTQEKTNSGKDQLRKRQTKEKTNSGKDKLRKRQSQEKTNSGKDKLRKDKLRKRQTQERQTQEKTNSGKDKLRKRQTPEGTSSGPRKSDYENIQEKKSSTNCSVKAKTTNLSNGTISVLRLLSTVYCLKGNKTDVPYTDNDTSKLRGECERVVSASLFNKHVQPCPFHFSKCFIVNLSKENKQTTAEICDTETNMLRLMNVFNQIHVKDTDYRSTS